MAIMVYTGVMGSGKTYEGVGTAALNALRAGRRVVTNIAGFNYERIRAFLGKLASGDELGEDRVVVVPSARITDPHFFYDPENNADSVVKPGDLVLIDEVWAFWGTDSKLHPEHQKFFRMHRHYTEEGAGTSCDLVIMIQDLMSLHRFIRGVIESNFKFTKMKTLGLSSCYRVEVYEGNKQRKANLVSATVKKYDKRIFPLYKSYDGGVGKESVVDGRQNLFHNKWFLFVMICAVVGLIGAGTWFARYVGHMINGGKDQKPSPAAVAPTSTAPGAASPAAAVTPTPPSDVRLVALTELATGETLVVFQLADGRLVRQRMNGGLIDGWESQASYQGRLVGFSFGSKSK